MSVALVVLMVACSSSRRETDGAARDSGRPSDAGALDGTTAVRLVCQDRDSCQICDGPACACSGRLYCSPGTCCECGEVECPPWLAFDAGPEFDGGTGEMCGPVGASCTTEAGPDQICLPSAIFIRGEDDAPFLDVAIPRPSPEARVYVSALWMDRTEVTVGSYRDCVALGDCTAPMGDADRAYYRDNANLERPMIGLQYQQMIDYCRYAGGRLPTETEWERAARGAMPADYPWGTADTSCERANWLDCEPGPAMVGSHPMGASPEGVLDLIGNVHEATSDRAEGGDYRAYGDEGVCDPAHPLLGGTFSYIARGCSWVSEFVGDRELSARACKGYVRYRRGTSSFDNVGFRCVRDG